MTGTHNHSLNTPESWRQIEHRKTCECGLPMRNKQRFSWQDLPGYFSPSPKSCNGFFPSGSVDLVSKRCRNMPPSFFTITRRSETSETTCKSAKSCNRNNVLKIQLSYKMEVNSPILSQPHLSDDSRVQESCCVLDQSTG